MRQHYTAEQLAASAAAGDPREESDFSDRAAFQRWQDEWFSVVTMGETLPQVGDPNRAKRWKATRRQRNAIETQRQLMEAPRAEPPRPLDETYQDRSKDLRSEQQRARRERQRQERDAVARVPGTKERQEQKKVEEQVAKLHDVAGASIVENALLLPHYNAYDAACKKRTRRLDEQEALLAQLLVKAGAADSTADAQRFIQAAHVLGIIHARYDKLVTFVHSLACQAQWYIRFLDRLHHAGEAARLPRGPGEVPGDTPEDMDEECSAKFARLSFNARQLMNLPAEGGILRARYFEHYNTHTDGGLWEAGPAHKTIEIDGQRVRASRFVWRHPFDVCDIESGKFPPQHGAPRSADGQTEMRSFYCYVDWATTDLPGLDYAVAKAICTAAWTWLDHFHPEIGDEHGYPDFLVGTQPESWDQGAVQMEVEEGVLV